MLPLLLIAGVLMKKDVVKKKEAVKGPCFTAKDLKSDANLRGLSQFLAKDKKINAGNGGIPNTTSARYGERDVSVLLINAAGENAQPATNYIDVALAMKGVNPQSPQLVTCLAIKDKIYVMYDAWAKPLIDGLDELAKKPLEAKLAVMESMRQNLERFHSLNTIHGDIRLANFYFADLWLSRTILAASPLSARGVQSVDYKGWTHCTAPEYFAEPSNKLQTVEKDIWALQMAYLSIICPDVVIEFWEALDELGPDGVPNKELYNKFMMSAKAELNKINTSLAKKFMRWMRTDPAKRASLTKMGIDIHRILNELKNGVVPVNSAPVMSPSPKLNHRRSSSPSIVTPSPNANPQPSSRRASKERKSSRASSTFFCNIDEEHNYYNLDSAAMAATNEPLVSLRGRPLSTIVSNSSRRPSTEAEKSKDANTSVTNLKAMEDKASSALNLNKPDNSSNAYSLLAKVVPISGASNAKGESPRRSRSRRHSGASSGSGSDSKSKCGSHDTQEPRVVSSPAYGSDDGIEYASPQDSPRGSSPLPKSKKESGLNIDRQAKDDYFRYKQSRPTLL